MSKRDLIQTAGIILFFIGFMLVPRGKVFLGMEAKRQVNTFARLADTGWWLEHGLILMVAGALVFLLSWLLSDRL